MDLALDGDVPPAAPQTYGVALLPMIRSHLDGAPTRLWNREDYSYLDSLG